MDDTCDTSPSHSRIYLTGFMGSGKSTLGAALAGRIGYTFVDLDDQVVDRLGVPIATFFREQGEARFRREESAELKETAALDRAIIAVGGGALVSESNLAFAKAHGLVVFLMVDRAEILRRLHAEQVTRPMLLDEEGALLPSRRVEERIARLYAAREPYYHRAHIAVDVGGLAVEEGVDRLRAAIERHARSATG